MPSTARNQDVHCVRLSSLLVYHEHDEAPHSMVMVTMQKTLPQSLVSA